MARLNKKTPSESTVTHGGASVKKIQNAEELLRRSVMSCLLWEDTHYEDGVSIAQRIKDLIPQVSANRVAEIALEARSLMKLRHVPLLIVREMARITSHKHLVAKTLAEVIQRPDELTEFLSHYWSEKKQPLSAQVKKGLGTALAKFNEYNLAKYNQDKDIKLRDVLFLSHSKPTSGISGYTRKERKAKKPIPQDPGSQLYGRLVAGTMKTPETWEVAISAKGNNKASWESLLVEGKLGDLALIRNLRNMTEADVDPALISKAIKNMKGTRVLPFRYIAAAQHAPKFEADLEGALLRCLQEKQKLPGKTIVVVDVSGSMYGTTVSRKSEMDRAKAACSLAAIAREACENPVIYATAGNDGTRVHKTQLVPNRHGFSLTDAIYNLSGPLGGGGIFLVQVMDYIKKLEKETDRIIVITDEQDCDTGTSPDEADAFGKHNYIINVSTYKNGIGYGKWTHINGWSEAILDYILISEEGITSNIIEDEVIQQ